VKKLKTIPKNYVLALLFLLFILIGNILDMQIASDITAVSTSFALKMLIIVPFVFILISLIDAWLPKEIIEKHIGEGSGIKGTIFITALAMLQGGPLYVAFPAAYLLWKKGCSIRNLFMYLGAFGTLKVPMIIFEFSLLGAKFAMLRAIVALPIFIIIAEIMALYAKRNQNVIIHEKPIMIKREGLHD
jgi:uncharacterized membrane protein YraQ (UPF0718 family)